MKPGKNQCGEEESNLNGQLRPVCRVPQYVFQTPTTTGAHRSTVSGYEFHPVVVPELPRQRAKLSVLLVELADGSTWSADTVAAPASADQ